MFTWRISAIVFGLSADFGNQFLIVFVFSGLFIIDKKGILRQITLNDLPVGRSVDETLRLVQAFQYTDQHGEVCPANWKPGAKTIIPNPEAKLKYFDELWNQCKQKAKIFFNIC